MLAAIANQTGGNLYVDQGMALADDAAGVSLERANAENLRRGARIGETLADWTRATVFWPEKLQLPAELGDVLPKSLPPLRTDRDTVVFGSADKKLAAPVAIELTGQIAGKPADLKWQATPAKSDDSYAYLSQLVDDAQADGGLTTSAIGLAGLAETGRMLEGGLEQMNQLAQRAVMTGDLAAAKSMSQAVLRRDPGNIPARTVQQVVARKSATDTDKAAGASDELNLVRPAQAPVPFEATPLPYPSEGALVDRFDQEGRC